MLITTPSSSLAGHEFGRKGLNLVIDALRLLPDHITLLIAGGRQEDIRAAQRHCASQDA